MPPPRGPIGLAGLVAAIVLTGCAGSPGQTPTATGTSGPPDAASTAPAPAGTDPSSHAGHGGEEPTGSDAPLEDALLTVADLPEGYVAAEGHHGDGAEHAVSEVADESCHAFAALLVGGHGADTARADTSFTLSHLGPTVTQAVVAYDDAEAAQGALGAAARAVESCPTYAHPGSHGTTSEYVVAPLTIEGLGEDAVGVEFTGASEDLAHLGYDVVVTAVDNVLVAVGFQSQTGLDADLLAELSGEATAKLR